MKYTYRLFCVFLICLQPLLAQTDVKPRRRRSMIGVLYNNKVEVYKTVGEKFKLASIVIGNSVKDIRFSKGDIEGMSEKIKSSGCSHIFTVGIQSAKAALKSGVPGAFSMVMDPFAKGLIKKDGMPASNLTGILMDVSPMAQIKILKEVLGEKNRLGLIHKEAYAPFIIDGYVKAYQDSGFQMVTKRVAKGSEVMVKFEELKGEVDFCISLMDPVCYNKKTMPLISRFSLINKIPFIGCSRKQVKIGGLIGFYNNYEKLGEQAAEFLDDLLTKENISNIPAIFSTSVDYVINTQTAQVMKLNFPDSIALSASMKYGE